MMLQYTLYMYTVVYSTSIMLDTDYTVNLDAILKDFIFWRIWYKVLTGKFWECTSNFKVNMWPAKAW